VIRIVLNGTFYCSRAVGTLHDRAQARRVDRLDSRQLRLDREPGHHPLAAAKAGVMSMTQTLAVEWAPHGIRVNAVAPGPIESPGAAKQLWNTPGAVDRITRMVPSGRWGSAEEVADAVAFLVAPQSGFITGEVLTGGRRVKAWGWNVWFQREISDIYSRD
jgi:NAD(P)-dependent dehydrogenase (short-subunit alcohol dehydrogenase family)